MRRRWTKEGSPQSLLMVCLFLLFISVTYSQTNQPLYTSTPFTYPNRFNSFYYQSVKLLTYNSTVMAFAEMFTDGGQNAYIAYVTSTDIGRTWSKVNTVTPVDPKVLTWEESPIADLIQVNGKWIIRLQYVDMFTDHTYQRISTDFGLTWSEKMAIPSDHLGFYALFPNSCVDARSDNGAIFYTGQIYAKGGHKSRIYKSSGNNLNFEPLMSPTVDIFGGSYSQLLSGPGFLTMIYSNESDYSHFYSTTSTNQGKDWNTYSLIDIANFGATSFAVKKVGSKYLFAVEQPYDVGHYGNLTIFSSPQGKEWTYVTTVFPGIAGDVDIIPLVAAQYGVIFQNGILDVRETITFAVYAYA